MQTLTQAVLDVLDNLKTDNITVLDVSRLSNVTDCMIVATANSTRHAKATAQKMITAVKEQQQPCLGIEGEQDGEWILLDLGNLVVHLMLPHVRDFYRLERLWADRNLTLAQAS